MDIEKTVFLFNFLLIFLSYVKDFCHCDIKLTIMNVLKKYNVK